MAGSDDDLVRGAQCRGERGSGNFWVMLGDGFLFFSRAFCWFYHFFTVIFFVFRVCWLVLPDLV